MRPTEDDVHWIVNSLGELGVEVGGHCFFCYNGESLEYKEPMHDEDGTPILYREIGKREFGETVWPMKWMNIGKREDRYCENLKFDPVLSFGKPEDCEWKPLPGPASK